jgi:hypothetical protein
MPCARGRREGRGLWQALRATIRQATAAPPHGRAPARLLAAELGARYFLTLHEWAQRALQQFDQDGAAT